MKVPFLDLAREHADIREGIESAVHRVIASGWYILGGELEALEAEFAAALGARHAVGVGSGTDAIHLALRACGIGEGDAVACPVHTAAPTVCAILQAGATPVFVDICNETYVMAPEKLESCLEGRGNIRAVIPVHLYGHPCDMARIGAIAARHGAMVIEDCAQSHGATIGGRTCGTIGAAGCFSFYPTKNLGACGDAGMVATNDDAVADRLRRLRNYGEVRKYENAEYGINSRLDEIQAAILRVKLPHLASWNAARREVAASYRAGLANAEVVLPVEAPGVEHVYHLFVIRHSHRDALRTRLGDAGIGTSIHYPMPLHHQSAYRRYVGEGDVFPVAERVCATCLSLPMSPSLSDSAMEAVVAGVSRALEQLAPESSGSVPSSGTKHGRA